MVARDRERHHQWDEAADQRRRAWKVDVADGGGGPDVGHRDEDEEDRDQAHRQVDVEDPAPAPAVGDISAGRGTDDRREAEHGAEEAGETRPLARWKEIADDREDGGEEHAAEDALDGPEGDELEHAVRLAAQRRGSDEADHAGEQERLAAEEIAELAGDR